MNIKFIRPTKNGTHTFDRYNYPSPFDKSTYKVIQDIQKEDLKKFNKDIYSDLSNKDKIRIFFFAEYIKRQFYLDCIVEKDTNGNYKKKKTQKLETYIDKKYTDVQSFADTIPSLYASNKEKKDFLFSINLKNDKFFNTYISFNHDNLYFFIKDTYFYYLNKLIDIIKNPFKYFNTRISDIDKDFLVEFSSKQHSFYEYEKIFYHISKYNFLNRQRLIPQELYKIIELINRHLSFIFNFSLLDLYSDITNYYLLYPSHLFNITDINTIISNNFQIQNLSRFFFLPKENKIDNPLEDIISCVLDNTSGKMDISINLTQKNFDSIEISKYISDQIIIALYSYKEYTQKNYSELEIKNFCNYIDTFSKKNETSNTKERAISLYIWDLIHIHKKHPSIREHVTRIYKNLYKEISENDIRKYQRAFSATSRSIEKREIFPLTKCNYKLF